MPGHSALFYIPTFLQDPEGLGQTRTDSERHLESPPTRGEEDRAIVGLLEMFFEVLENLSLSNSKLHVRIRSFGSKYHERIRSSGSKLYQTSASLSPERAGARSTHDRQHDLRAASRQLR